MPSTTPPKKPRNPSGFPTIRASHGRLQVSWKYQGVRQYLSLGMDDTPINQTRAYDIALAIWSDLNLNRYDPTKKEDYLPDFRRRNTSIEENIGNYTFNQIWVIYLNSDSHGLGVTTLANKIPSITKFLASHSGIKLDDAETLVKFLSKGVSDKTFRTKYGCIRAALTWAQREKLIKTNSLKEHVLQRIKDDDESGGDPFENYELVELLAAFKVDKGIEWYDVISFLLFTGCRPSEAFGLRWGDVCFKQNKITFQSRRIRVNGKPEDMPGLKTQKKRVFPMGTDLIQLLTRIKSRNNHDKNDYVLIVGNTPLDTDRLNRVWFGSRVKGQWRYKGVVTKLAESDLILRYRTAYSLRDTFITHSLKAGKPIHTVAKWVGNSAAIIDKHYANALNEVSPESPFMLP